MKNARDSYAVYTVSGRNKRIKVIRIMIKVKLNDWKLDYQMDEAYKALRTNLQFCGADKKIIAFTSCTPNEGKSNVTFHLAASLAESGKSVLLVDADLRKSVLLGRVQVDEEIKGLAHYLSKQVKLADVICATDLPKFHIIFSGIVPPNPAELLGGRLFKDMMRLVRDVYDYVIIDTPPLGSVIDSAVIADACDGSVIVIEAGTISYRFVQEVKSQLEKSNCPIIGTILNKVDYGKKGYYGRYGRYGKYGRYGNYGNYGDR